VETPNFRGRQGVPGDLTSYHHLYKLAKVAGATPILKLTLLFYFCAVILHLKVWQ
jgi:hypothetical protein